MDFEQLLGQLLAKGDGQEGLAFEVLLVVLGGVVTQVDVHCITGCLDWVVKIWTKHCPCDPSGGSSHK